MIVLVTVFVRMVVVFVLQCSRELIVPTQLLALSTVILMVFVKLVHVFVLLDLLVNLARLLSVAFPHTVQTIALVTESVLTELVNVPWVLVVMTVLIKVLVPICAHTMEFAEMDTVPVLLVTAEVIVPNQFT